MHHMWLALGESVELKGHGYQQHRPTDDEPYFYFGYHPTSESLTSELALVPTTEGIRALVGVNEQSQIPDQVKPWADALIEATKRLNLGHPEHEWWAIIGPSEHESGSAQVLSSGFKVHDLEVRASTTPYFDAVEQSQWPSISSASIHVSFPVTVHGKARGYDWHTASAAAGRDLSQLCALLSVAFDAHWRIRQSPVVQNLADRPLPLTRFNPEQFQGMEHDNWARSDVVAPEWLDNAWRKVDSDDTLRTALYAYQQGLRMEAATPSYALIAFVGVVEGVGATLVPPATCDCCNACTVQTGAGKRFRAALKLILPAKKVKHLASAVYSRRSQTAHEGRLHGDELDIGALPMGKVFAPRPTSEEFRYRVLWDMHRASRKLLLHFLAEEAAPPGATETRTETESA